MYRSELRRRSTQGEAAAWTLEETNVADKAKLIMCY